MCNCNWSDQVIYSLIHCLKGCTTTGHNEGVKVKYNYYIAFTAFNCSICGPSPLLRNHCCTVYIARHAIAPTLNLIVSLYEDFWSMKEILHNREIPRNTLHSILCHLNVCFNPGINFLWSINWKLFFQHAVKL